MVSCFSQIYYSLYWAIHLLVALRCCAIIKLGWVDTHWDELEGKPTYVDKKLEPRNCTRGLKAFK